MFEHLLNEIKRNIEDKNNSSGMDDEIINKINKEIQEFSNSLCRDVFKKIKEFSDHHQFKDVYFNILGSLALTFSIDHILMQSKMTKKPELNIAGTFFDDIFRAIELTKTGNTNDSKFKLTKFKM